MGRPEGFDYIVVGGGTAGCVVAARLAENPDARILLIEAGPRDSHPAIGIPGASAFTVAAPGMNWHRMTEPQAGLNGRSLYLAQGRVIGGGSSINGMVYTRGTPADYAGWVEDGAAGWGYDDVLPWFRHAETYARGANAWHGGDGPLRVERGRSYLPIVDSFLRGVDELGIPIIDDLNVPAAEGVGHYDWTVGNGRRSSTASAYLKPMRRNPRLTIHSDSHATRLIVEGGRAVGVDYLRDGRTCRATADAEVILCGGAINSPQLLMLSGIGPADHLRAAGIAPVLDLPMVGANLRNHLSYKISYRCAAPISAYNYLHPVRGALELAKYALAHRGFLSQGSSPAGGFYRSSARAEEADMQIFMVPLILGDVGSGLMALLPKEHGVSFFVNQAQPFSTGTVRLGSSDPLAAPVIDPRFLSDPRDMEILIDGIQRLAPLGDTAALRAIGAQPLSTTASGSRAEIAEHIREVANNHYHVCGTCRIGEDAASSVVDSALRVHGMEGLRVADASVMPRMLNANLGAPVIMIAERAAAFIRSAATP